MTKYIHFTQEQKEQARQTDLCDLLRAQGETLKRSGSEYEWKDGSQKVTIRGNLWFHQYEQQGGDAIDFIRRFYNKDYPDAVEYLLGDWRRNPKISPAVVREPSKPLELPSRNDNMRRVFAYLLYQRGIHRDVAYAFAHKQMIYESEKYHNVVFVGYDKNGNPRHANLRGTGKDSTFKGNAVGSVPEYSFHWTGRSEKLFLFEAPIDMLSFISMNIENWQQHSYAAACSVSDKVLFQMLKDNPNISEVYLCLDSDEPGQAAAKRISDKLFIQGISATILIPEHKDWNEDLLNLNREEHEEEPCQVLQL